MKSYTLDDLARMIDHTNLHTDASPKDMEVLCNEAKEHHFAMVPPPTSTRGFRAPSMRSSRV